LIEGKDFEELFEGMCRRAEDILRTHKAAVYLTTYYRAGPPRIFIYRDRVHVLVKEGRVIYGFLPYDLEAGGYREVGRGRYWFAYRFLPGKSFQVELEGILLEKEAQGDRLREEMRALFSCLGVFDLVPLIGWRKAADMHVDGVSLRLQKFAPGVELPSYAHEGDAGLDLRSAEDVVLGPGERALVSTGFAMALPEGYAAFVQPRSGLAAKHGISIVNTPGLIDCHYRGEVKVILVNLGQEEFRVRKGDRIAQMVIQRVESAEVVEVEELDETSRGEGGFGSTGR